jgi:hypothetical protein
VWEIANQILWRSLVFRISVVFVYYTLDSYLWECFQNSPDTKPWFLENNYLYMVLCSLLGTKLWKINLFNFVHQYLNEVPRLLGILEHKVEPCFKS